MDNQIVILFTCLIVGTLALIQFFASRHAFLVAESNAPA